MDNSKRQKLESAGWATGSAEELLGGSFEEELAGCAAKWWAHWMTSWAPFDNGDKESMGSGLAMIVSAESQIRDKNFTEAEVEAFRTAVMDRVMDFLTDPKRWKYLDISVDYGPDINLIQCWEATGIELERIRNVFPIKTVMWIHPDRVVCRQGYTGAEVQIFPKIEN